MMMRVLRGPCRRNTPTDPKGGTRAVRRLLVNIRFPGLPDSGSDKAWIRHDLLGMTIH